jgi:hypothetical protein
MDGLTNWIMERMAAYHGGGVPYNEAARFTYGELRAIYRGRHWTGGKPTPAPDIPEREAAELARSVLREIQGTYEGEISA